MAFDYVGRFAPTPSGFLHFGSLLAALASWLDARAQGGRWLLRIEDLDPPREVPGATTAIIRTLEQYGLYWDGDILRQSERQAIYRDCVETLLQQGLAYACTCSRKQLEPFAGRYPGTCRHAGHGLTDAAIRLQVPASRYQVQDRAQGRFAQQLEQEVGDFVIRRRDGLYAYQLAVVLDDAAQGITHVVRGADLLDSTPRQLYLQDVLGLPHPQYLHIPLLIAPDGHKLGKSYRSPPLLQDQVPSLLVRALATLGQQPPRELLEASVAEILRWGTDYWQPAAIPKKMTLAEAQIG